MGSASSDSEVRNAVAYVELLDLLGRAPLDNPPGDLGAGGEPELDEDVLDVTLGGSLGDDQTGSDFLVAHALCDELGDLTLPRRER